MMDQMAENLHDLHCETINNLVIVPENTLLMVNYHGSRQMVIAEACELSFIGAQIKCSHCRYTFGGRHSFLLLSQHEPEMLGYFSEFVLHPDRAAVHEVMQSNGLTHPCDLVMARTIDSMLSHYTKDAHQPKKIMRVMRAVLEMDRFRNAEMMF